MIYIIEKHLPGLQNLIQIFDEEGELVYYFDSKLFLGERIITLYSDQDEKLADIRQVRPSYEAKFQIILEGEVFGELTKEFSYFDARVHIISEYGPIISEGDIVNLDFRLKNVEGEILAEVDDQLTEDEDTYGVEIPEEVDDEFILCLLMIMDVLFNE